MEERVNYSVGERAGRDLRERERERFERERDGRDLREREMGEI